MAWLAMVLALSACQGSGGVGLTYEQRWTGPVTPDNAACGPPTQGTLTRRAGDFTFAPSDGVLVIEGKIDTDGHLRGTLSLIGADHHPYPLTLDGKLTPGSFQGEFTTNRCRSRVSLRAVV